MERPMPSAPTRRQRLLGLALPCAGAPLGTRETTVVSATQDWACSDPQATRQKTTRLVSMLGFGVGSGASPTLTLEPAPAPTAAQENSATSATEKRCADQEGPVSTHPVHASGVCAAPVRWASGRGGTILRRHPAPHVLPGTCQTTGQKVSRLAARKPTSCARASPTLPRLPSPEAAAASPDGHKTRGPRRAPCAPRDTSAPSACPAPLPCVAARSGTRVTTPHHVLVAPGGRDHRVTGPASPGTAALSSPKRG